MAKLSGDCFAPLAMTGFRSISNLLIRDTTLYLHFFASSRSHSACYQAHAVRHVIKCDPNRHALCQPHPTEGWVHVLQPIMWALRVVAG